MLDQTQVLLSLSPEEVDDSVILEKQLDLYIQRLRDQSQAWLRLSLIAGLTGFVLVGIATNAIINRANVWVQIVSGALLIIWAILTVDRTRRLSLESRYVNARIDVIRARLSSIFEGQTRTLERLVSKRKQAEPSVTEITLVSSEEELTSDYLEVRVNPFLNAITDVQHVIDEIHGRKPSTVVIKEIRKNSPISVSLDGAAEAVGVVRDTVVPWRRKHAESMARLFEQEKQAEIESKRAEVLEKRARAAKDRAEAESLAAEAAKQREEAEKLKLENDRLRLELQRAKIELALDILNRLAPNLPETEKIGYLIKLLPPLDTLIFSSFEIATNTPN